MPFCECCTVWQVLYPGVGTQTICSAWDDLLNYVEKGDIVSVQVPTGRVQFSSVLRDGCVFHSSGDDDNGRENGGYDEGPRSLCYSRVSDNGRAATSEVSASVSQTGRLCPSIGAEQFYGVWIEPPRIKHGGGRESEETKKGR